MASETVHLNMSGVSLSFDPLEPGTYDARVKECSVGESKASGQPVVKWQFEVDEPPYEGRVLFFNTSLQAQAIWKFAQTMQALGFEEEELTGEGGFEFEPDDTIDLECRVVVTQDSYRGEITNRVDRVLPLEDLAGASPQVLVAAADDEGLSLGEESEEIPF